MTTIERKKGKEEKKRRKKGRKETLVLGMQPNLSCRARLSLAWDMGMGLANGTKAWVDRGLTAWVRCVVRARGA